MVNSTRTGHDRVGGACVYIKGADIATEVRLPGNRHHRVGWHVSVFAAGKCLLQPLSAATTSDVHVTAVAIRLVD